MLRSLQFRHLSSKVLRPYQQRCIDEAVALYEAGSTQILFPIATGLGKTVLFGQLQAQLRKRQPHKIERVLCLVHRDELLQQAKTMFETQCAGEVIGLEAADHSAPDNATIVVASVATLGRKKSTRMQKFADFRGLVIVDEAHHMAVDNSYDRILRHLGIKAKRLKNRRLVSDTSHQPLLAGFTATPYRSDGKDLMVFFDQAITPLDLVWGIRHGYLVDIKVVNVHTITDLNGVHVRMREFSQNQLGATVNNHKRNSAIVRAIQQYGGKSCIAFCASVEHAHELAEMLRLASITAECVDGFIDKELRAERLAKFRNGEVQVLTNFGVLTEGVDVPACDTIVMCRPTLSKALYMQMLGRGTRPVADVASADVKDRLDAIKASSKPQMVVIDIVDVCARHDIVSVASVLGVHPRYEWKGASVLGLANELDQLLAGDDDGSLSAEIKESKDLEQLRMKVRTYRLLDRATKNPKQAWQDLIASLRAGDRIGYRYDSTAPVGARDEAGCMCMPAIDVIVTEVMVYRADESEFETTAQDLRAQLTEATSKAAVNTIKQELRELRRLAKQFVEVSLQPLHPTSDGAAAPITLRWKTSRAKATEGEDDCGGIHEGRTYSLQAIVDWVDPASSEFLEELEGGDVRRCWDICQQLILQNPLDRFALEYQALLSQCLHRGITRLEHNPELSDSSWEGSDGSSDGAEAQDSADSASDTDDNSKSESSSESETEEGSGYYNHKPESVQNANESKA